MKSNFPVSKNLELREEKTLGIENKWMMFSSAVFLSFFLDRLG